MTKLEKTFRSMMKASLLYLTTNRSRLSKYPLILQIGDRLIKTDLRFDEYAAKQQNAVGGQVDDKNAQLLRLGQSCYKLNCSLTYIAKSTKNAGLLRSVDESISAFIKGSEDKIFEKCELIIALGFEYVQPLSELGFSKEQLEALQLFCSDVKKKPVMVSSATNEQKLATQAIKLIIQDAQADFDLIDNLMEGLVEEESIVDEWFEYRKIKGRHRVKKHEEEDIAQF